MKLADGNEVGQLGIYHARRFWSSAMAQRQGSRYERPGEAHFDRVLLDCLGVSLGQTSQFLFSYAPAFEAFEQWVIDTAGMPEPDRVCRFNNEYSGSTKTLHSIEELPPVLNSDDLQFWQENGYIRVCNAVDRHLLDSASQAVWEAVKASPDQPQSWYNHGRSGIMVELIQHQALEAVRRSSHIHKAFAQLWETSSLWVSADRCSFHPPQTPEHSFQGPDLHWDVDFDQPVPFFTQGILYLTDTPAEQGALTLVPGFHHQFEDWQRKRENGSPVDISSLHAEGSIPVPGLAGDLVIWHHWLPHGARPNQGKAPRLVQYINRYPMHLERI